MGVLRSERVVERWDILDFVAHLSDIAIYCVFSGCVRVWAVSPGLEVSADGVHWGPSGFYLAASVHFSACSLEGRFTAPPGSHQALQ